MRVNDAREDTAKVSYSISERLSRLIERRTGGDVHARVHAGAHRAATSPHNSLRDPTPAQADAGNYRKGRIELHGLLIAIENPAGSVRRGVGEGGKPWANVMKAHYGDLTGTRGADGDPVDVFVGPFPESKTVWIINQALPGKPFDEHKVMMGFGSEQMARDAYTGSYDPGWSGMQSIHRATIAQLKWWLKNGDHAQPFDPNQLPSDGYNDMDKIIWNKDAEPVTTTMPKLLYAMRSGDPGGLLLDSVDIATLLSDDELEAEPVLDAMVVPVARMPRRMDLLKRMMNAAGDGLTVTDYTIADPIRAKGALQVVVMFALSDGQAITIWFHNPDTTPNKLTPLDDLVSWKWMLNKSDITLVVAPERGLELNPREVARRAMRLANRNSDAFKKANAKLAEKTATLAALDIEIAALEETLAERREQLAAARIAAAERARLPSIEEQAAAIATPAGYAKIKDDEAALLKWQDWLDPLFAKRIIDVRNALRERGWSGEAYKALSKDGYNLVVDLTQVGGGKNVVGVTYRVVNSAGGQVGLESVDMLVLSADDMADRIDSKVADDLEQEAEPDTLVADTVEALRRGESPIQRMEPGLPQFMVSWGGDELVLTDELRAQIEAALGEPLVERVVQGRGISLVNLVPQSMAPAAQVEEGFNTPGELAAAQAAAVVEPIEAVAAAEETIDPATAGPQEGDERRTTDGEIVVFKDGQWWAWTAADESGELPPVLVRRPDAQFQDEAAPPDDVSAAVAALEVARDVAATNEPINRAEGNIEQADLEAQTVEQIDNALETLKSDAMADAAAKVTVKNAEALAKAIGMLEGVADTVTFAQAINAANNIDMHMAPGSYALLKQTSLGIKNVNGKSYEDFTVAPGDFRAYLDALKAALATVTPAAEPPPGIDIGADREWLQGLIDGTGDMLAPETFDKLEALFAKYDGLKLIGAADVRAMVEQAAEAVGNAAVAAAQKELGA